MAKLEINALGPFCATCNKLRLDKLEEQEKFMRWLAKLVTHEDGEGAECEIICRRLYKMGYVEKHDTKDGKYWRATKAKEGWE